MLFTIAVTFVTLRCLTKGGRIMTQAEVFVLRMILESTLLVGFSLLCTWLVAKFRTILWPSKAAGEKKWWMAVFIFMMIMVIALLLATVNRHLLTAPANLKVSAALLFFNLSLCQIPAA